MRRRRRETKPTIAVVVDGDNERWYFQMLCRNEQKLPVKIKPELPKKSSVREQYEKVVDLLDVGYDKVFWIVDMDQILKETRESSPGKSTPLTDFIQFRRELSDRRNCVIIVNNPCLEFWILLHFLFTGRSFSDCSDAINALKKNLPDYQKSQNYYTKSGNDIYSKLKPNLKEAINHSKLLGSFDSENPYKGMCEMEYFFEDPLLENYY